MALSPGARLGPYEIVAPLGAGGMGEVYRARDTRLGRDVALKILPEEVAGDATRRARFEQEARAVAALNHPNIVAVYDVGEGYMVSELVDGETLRAAKPGLRKTLDLATQIASGLAAAHAAGIVHRDLKPENILVTRDGRAKILDFGLARVQKTTVSDATVTAHTEPGAVMGTAGYMSPEQVRGVQADHRSDIFSFGVILHEMLGGANPFHGETGVDIMQAILRQEAPELPRTVPAGVREIVSHCLEKDVDHRFQSAGDLSFALHALARGDSQSEAAIPRVAAAPRRRWMWVAALAVLAAGVTLALALWFAKTPAAARWSAVRLGGPEIAMDPRLSPDGHLLAFQAMVDGITEVAVMKPESGNWNILTKRRDQGEVVGVSWSPDGSLIYFSRHTSVPQGIFSVPLLGGEERLVLDKATRPSALPDGTLLIWRINSAGRMQLFRFWHETGQLQDLPVEAQTLAGKIGTSRDGRHAFVLGRLLGKSTEAPSLIEVDLAAASARPIAANGLSGLRTVAFAPDGTSAIATVGGGSLVRIVRIPLDGRGSLQELFTVTSDVWDLDAGADGSVFLTLQDRPSELVSIPAGGGQLTKIASIPQQPGDMIGGLVALPDGRFVVESAVSGRSRLIALEPGKMPAPLVNTSEETGNPLTAVARNRIAFAIGSAPADSIGIADISSGRIAVRISPHKGSLTSLTASPDGGTLFFTAGGVVWSVPASGGEARRISAGDFVEVKPSDGNLVVARSESSQIRLYEVPPAGGAERTVPLDPAIHLLSPSTAPGEIRADGQMLAVLQPPDTWFSPLVLIDLKSGRLTRLAGDRVSDIAGSAFARDGKIVAQRMLLYSTIWKFTPEKR